MRRSRANQSGRPVWCVVWGLMSCLIAASGAHAQLVEGGDIGWEAEWAALAPLLGAAAPTADLDANQVYDAWECAMAEVIVSHPGVAGHAPAHVAQFNTTLAALQGENAALAAAYGQFCALSILRGRFADVNAASLTLYSIGLTPGLYTSLAVVTGAGDPDSDAIPNAQERARDSANYVIQATTPARSYRFGSPVDLLDAAFYASGLKAWEGTVNNAGTTVAFYAVNASFETAIYLVDLGNPSSWRPLTAVIPDATPDTAIAWTPDDSALLVAFARIPITTGAIVPTNLFGYEPNDPTVTALPDHNWMFIHQRTPVAAEDASVCQGGDLAFEFETDGDAEGWAPQNSVSALTVSGGTLQGTITGGDPYIVANPTPFAAAQNPFVIIKLKTSFTGRFSFFWWNDVDGTPHAEGRPLGTPNQFNIYAIGPEDLGSGWTGNITTVRVDPSDNLDSGSFEIEYVRFCSGATYAGGGRNLVALPILGDGTADISRSPVIVSNFASATFPGGLAVDWPNVSPDGNRISFAAYSESDTPGIPDGGDIYTVDNVAAIMAAPKIPGTIISSLAPTSLGDPRLAPVRAGEVPNNFAETPSITQDNQLVLYEEDLNNVFRNADFFGSVATCDVDVFISQADGNGRDFQVTLPGHQIAPTLSRGGTRVLYASTIADVLDFHLFIANLESETPVIGTPLPGNDLLTTVEQTTSDTSGTEIVLPAGLTIDFPVGTPQAIQVTTPIDPVTEAQLPPDAGIDAIPIVRQFGPSGTTFSAPVEVTVSYTDAEVAGMDEANIKIFLYNELTSAFDIPVTTVIRRDNLNNTIAFTVDHFSVFGLGAEPDTDSDGVADSTDPDDDNDGVLDGNDARPLDTDDDGVDNPDDFDDDADGLPDAEEAHPLDTDNDGSPNAIDSDDDTDGILDGEDLFLFDTDNDELRNDVDLDDDGDSVSDQDESLRYHTNALNPDTDGDGLSDGTEIQFGHDPLTPETDGAQLPVRGVGILATAFVCAFLLVRRRTWCSGRVLSR